MVVNNVLTADDFNFILDEYFGRTISHTAVTQSTNNLTGEETLTDGTPANIKCYTIKTGQNFNYKEMGFLEQGDVVGLFKIADTVEVNDKITMNGEVYRVKEKFDVPGVFTNTSDATLVYTVANLFLIS